MVLQVEFLTNARAEAERHLREVTAALDETASALATVEKSEGKLKARTGQLETQVATLTEELDILRPVRCPCKIHRHCSECDWFTLDLQMRSGYETLERRSAHYEAAWNGMFAFVSISCLCVKHDSLCTDSKADVRALEARLATLQSTVRYAMGAQQCFLLTPNPIRSTSLM